jgi:hypothetical protein
VIVPVIQPTVTTPAPAAPVSPGKGHHGNPKKTGQQTVTPITEPVMQTPLPDPLTVTPVQAEPVADPPVPAGAAPGRIKHDKGLPAGLAKKLLP